MRVGLFSSEPTYDRSRILDAASRARTRKRYRRATQLYRRVLAVEPANVDLHARLAPLLVATRRPFDAWLSYRVCAEAAVADNRLEQAAAIYREAARNLRHELDAWERLAATERARGHDREALAALVEARKHFRGRSRRCQAIYLLRRAREIEPWNPGVVLGLAKLLARTDQQSEAQLLLDSLADRCEGSELRRVRGAQWRISPTLRNTWRWLRASPGAGGTRAKQRMHA